MTKFFIAALVSCGLLIGAPALAASVAKKEPEKIVKKEIKKEIKKSKAVRTTLQKKEAKPQRKVVRLDFDKPAKKSVKPKKVAAKAKPKVTTKRLPASAPPVVTVAKLKNKKSYWSMHCKNGFVVKNNVYCAINANKTVPAKKLKQAKTQGASSKKLR